MQYGFASPFYGAGLGQTYSLSSFGSGIGSLYGGIGGYGSGCMGGYGMGYGGYGSGFYGGIGGCGCGYGASVAMEPVATVSYAAVPVVSYSLVPSYTMTPSYGGCATGFGAAYGLGGAYGMGGYGAMGGCGVQMPITAGYSTTSLYPFILCFISLVTSLLK